MLFLDDKSIDLLKQLYLEIPETVDQLPYTPQFDQLHARFEHSCGNTMSKTQFWRTLSSLRKRSLLPRKCR